MQKFKFLEHTADMKFQAFGKSLEKAFENSAYALINIMCKNKVKGKIKKKIKVKGKDLENLLYNFLEEFLFLLDSKNFVLGKINKISIITNTIKAGKHKLASEVSKDNEKDDNKDDNKEQYNHNKEYELVAEILGDNVKNYNFNIDVKAVTYNEMFVKKEKIKGKIKYICQVVVDV